MRAGLITPDACDALAGLSPVDGLFRRRVVMARHGFGRGEDTSGSDPLPAMIAGLRTSRSPPLVPMANRWNTALGVDVRYPATHAECLARGHAAGQRRPTPLRWQDDAGDYNCRPQDLYGEHVVPLQGTRLLSEPGRDCPGGEFVLTAQRPRLQSRPEVVPLRQGDAVVFAVHPRPVQSTRGVSRVTLRPGVRRLRAGPRHTVGIMCHDATCERIHGMAKAQHGSLAGAAALRAGARIMRAAGMDLVGQPTASLVLAEGEQRRTCASAPAVIDWRSQTLPHE